MFEWIMKLIGNIFPYNAKSFDDFVEFVRRGKCVSVTIEPYLYSKDGVETKAVGVIALWQYMLEFRATMSRGRNVVYRVCLFERFGSARGSGDSKKRSQWSNELRLRSEEEASKLRMNLPGVDIHLNRLIGSSCWLRNFQQPPL